MRLVEVAYNSLLKGPTFTSLKAPRVTFHSNNRSVPRRRELGLERSGFVQEADDVVGGRFGVGGDLAEPQVMINGLVS